MKRSMFALAGLAILAALIALVFGTLGEGGGKVEGAPGTITAEANGSVTPTPIPWPGPRPNGLTNGDFLIWRDTDAGPLGDGVDEHTSWTFDFCSSATSGDPLTSALLTLTLTPKSSLVDNDTVRIEGLTSINTPLIQELPVGVTSTVQLQLLYFYTSADILGTFNASPAGQIPMHYQDDSIISFAKLELEPASCDCPNPGAWPWTVPPGDADCDGFSSDDELVIGTDPCDPCANTPDSNDEADDRWPADFDDNQIINILDVGAVLPPWFGTTVPPTEARRDLHPDGVINILDVGITLPPYFGYVCGP